MEYKAVQAHIYGRVQGVFFRDYTRRMAEELGLTGWVKNCSDGSVESLICGDRDAVSAMINWLHQGSPSAKVDEVVIKTAVLDNSPTAFHIIA